MTPEARLYLIWSTSSSPIRHLLTEIGWWFAVWGDVSKNRKEKRSQKNKRCHLCSGVEEKVGDLRRMVAADTTASSGSIKDASSGKTTQLPQKGGGSSSSQSSSDQKWYQRRVRTEGWASLTSGRLRGFCPTNIFFCSLWSFDDRTCQSQASNPTRWTYSGLKVSRQDLCTCYQHGCTKPHSKHERITTSCTVINTEDE